MDLETQLDLSTSIADADRKLSRLQQELQDAACSEAQIQMAEYVVDAGSSGFIDDLCKMAYHGSWSSVPAACESAAGSDAAARLPTG